METVDLLYMANPYHAALCTNSRATWWRWLTGRSEVPRAAVNLLRIVAFGELPQGGNDWIGWRFVDGELFDPSNHGHTAGSIMAWWWVAQRLQARRAEENTRELPTNVVLLPSARPAHALTEELYRRLIGERKP